MLNTIPFFKLQKDIFINNLSVILHSSKMFALKNIPIDSLRSIHVQIFWSYKEQPSQYDLLRHSKDQNDQRGNRAGRRMKKKLVIMEVAY